MRGGGGMVEESGEAKGIREVFKENKKNIVSSRKMTLIEAI